MSNVKIPDLPPINSYLLQPTDWAVEAMKRAADYTGMPEGSWFTVEARRYLALGRRIQELETEVEALRDRAEEAGFSIQSDKDG